MGSPSILIKVSYVSTLTERGSHSLGAAWEGVLGESLCLKRDLEPAGRLYPLLLAPAWAPLSFPSLLQQSQRIKPFLRQAWQEGGLT